MAGHSKFKNIMHRKGAQDKKRAGVFNKHAREITVAAKLGGIDPDMNPRLRTAISAARAVNMPNDRIKRAVDVASPDNDDGTIYEEIRYEGYGPGGVAIIIQALTDNRNRTVADVRMLFSKNGGTLGETNSVAFMFDRVGEIVFPIEKGDADTMFEGAVEAGAENVESDDEGHFIYCAVEDYGDVLDALEKQFGTPSKSGLIWRPKIMGPVELEQAQTNMKLIDALEDLDDVQSIATNMDMSDEVAAQLDAE